MSPLSRMFVECTECEYVFRTHDGGTDETRTSCPRCPAEPLKFEHEVEP